MITKYPWFGPKRTFGWGWTPITREGWLITIIFLVTIAGTIVFCGRSPASIFPILGLSVLFLLIVVLTGTKPG